MPLIKQSNESTLEFYSQNKLPLKSKVALLVLYNNCCSNWIEKLLLVYEYLQLMSQGFLLCSAIAPSRGYFDEVVVYFFKLINPSYLLEYDGSRSLIWSILVIVFGLTGIKYLLTCYILFIAYKNRKGSRTLISIFRGILKLQARFTCFFVTSFWVNMILSISNKVFEFEDSTSKTLTITILSILVGIEYLYSFLIEMQFCDMLPRKNFLSGKNNEIQMITLGQKLMIQTLQLCFKFNPKGSFWVCTMFNLLFSTVGVQRLWLKLPLYNSKALYLLGDLTSVVLALNIMSFIGAILLSHNSDDFNIRLIIILWILSGVLLQRVSRNVLHKRIFCLLSCLEKCKEPALLIQKIAFSKELQETERVPAEETEKIHEVHFFNSIEKTQTPKDFKDLLAKSQQESDQLTRLFEAKFWFKECGLCSKALKIVAEIMRNPWSKEYISAFFLLQQIQKGYLKSEKNRLDFLQYTENQVLFAELKNEMVKQARMKQIVCQTMLSDSCDIGEIFDKSQIISRSKAKIDKRMDPMFRMIPESWIAPLLICSEYYLVMEHSSNKCTKYRELYTQKYLKYEKYFKNPGMIKDNIYQGTNGFIIFGGHKSENGVIKYCSKSMEKICGGEKKFYISKHISTLFMPSMQGIYKEFFQSILDKGDTALLQKVHRVFLFNKNGYMVEVDFSLWIHPNITQDFLLSMMIRPVLSFNEYLLVDENGDIQGASKKISKSLNLEQSSTLNIRSISNELFEANNIFNLVYRAEGIKSSNDRTKKKVNESLSISSKVIEFVNNFNSVGQEVAIMPLNDELQREIHYNCRISSISHEMPFLKLFTLSRIQSQDEKTTIGGDARTAARARNSGFIMELTPRQSKRTHGNVNTTEGNVIVDTERNGFLTETNPDMKITVHHAMSDLKNKNTESLEKNKQADNELNDFISVTTDTLKNSEEKEAYKVLKNTLKKKTHSNVFIILCLAFYGVVIVVLVCQILLKETSEKTMQDLVVKKNLLNNAQLRSYYACKIPFATGTQYLRSIGIELSSFFPQSNIPASVLLGVIIGYYNQLALANQNIINLLDTLDQGIIDQLFEKDVRIFGSVVDAQDTFYMNFTSFQAVQEIGISIQWLNNHLYETNGPNKTAALRFTMVNTLGDFLTKNLEITSIFQKSVEDQRRHLRNFIVLCLVISPLLLLAVALVLILIIWRQYTKETKYLEAFIKLHPRSIKYILEITSNFEHALVNDWDFEDKKTLEWFWKQCVFLDELHISSHHSKFETQVIDSRKTKKKYSSFVIWVGFYVTILIAVSLWNFLSSQRSLNIIYNKQSQLQLANKISEETSIDMLSMVQIFTRNNTANISQLPALNYTLDGIKRIKQLREEVENGFANIDGNYDPEVKKIVFDGEDCSVYGGFTTNYCKILINNGIPTSIVNLLSFFEQLIILKVQAFYSTDRSDLVNLAKALYLNTDINSPASSVLGFIAIRLNGVIEKQLGVSITDANNQQSKILTIFIITLACVSVMIWIQILSKIKELNNNFKRVLQVLPSRLILSSFLLKQFLNKISRNHF